MIKMVKMTLIQGDCLKALPTIPDKSVDLVLTDPPYNILGNKFEWDNVTIEFFKEWITECFNKVKQSGSFITFCSHIFVKDIRIISEDLGFLYRMMLVWDWRERCIAPTKNYKTGYDTILFFTKTNDYTFNRPYSYSECWNILKFTRIQSNRLEGKNYTGLKLHPTQKPESLIRHLIEIHSNKEDIVLDPFLGSGTTMKVAIKLGRSCIGIEIEPKYIDTTKRRLSWGSGLFDKVEWEFKKID